MISMKWTLSILQEWHNLYWMKLTKRFRISLMMIISKIGFRCSAKRKIRGVVPILIWACIRGQEKISCFLILTRLPLRKVSIRSWNRWDIRATGNRQGSIPKHNSAKKWSNLITYQTSVSQINLASIWEEKKFVQTINKTYSTIIKCNKTWPTTFSLKTVDQISFKRTRKNN